MPEVALSVLPAFDEVFALLLTLDTIKPHPSLPKRLGPLLKDLQKPAPSRDPKILAELVHALWITNRDSHAEELMAEAITSNRVTSLLYPYLGKFVSIATVYTKPALRFRWRSTETLI